MVVDMDLGYGPPLIYCVELVARLRLSAAFRRRDYYLLLSLRNTAVAWCRDHGIGDQGAARIVPGSVVVAMKWSPEEQAALLASRTADMAVAIRESDALSAGRPFWPFSPSLREWVWGRCTLMDVLWSWRARVGTPAVAIPPSGKTVL